MFEFWRAGVSESSTSAEAARAVEAEGWDGQMFMDSQCLSADPFVRMGAWAVATERLKLSTGVTNPLTRHLAVLAASAATVHAISGGRAVLGLGRGDSALAYLGHAPVGVNAFEEALKTLQSLLSGEAVDFRTSTSSVQAPELETLSLGDRPTASSLQWLPPGVPKVSLDVAATGPRVIDMAGRLAERVTFSVGAISERIAWAVDLAQTARAQQGIGGEVSCGAQVIVICHPDRAAALEMAAIAVAPLARFQVIQGDVAGPASADDAENFAVIRRSYDMTKHAKSLETSRLIGSTLTPEFVDRFAVAGPPDYCTARLLELIRCGLTRLVVVGPGAFPEADGGPRSLFAAEVIPAVRAELASTG